MRIRRLEIQHFRGFQSLSLTPRDHVFLVGQPGAGRSDVTEALWRVLSPDSTRGALVDDLDFHGRDRSKRIEVEVVLGALGTQLEQLFLDRLEFWHVGDAELITEIGPESEYVEADLEPVVRLCYRAEWEEDQQQAKHWVDFPKFTDLDGDSIVRVPRQLREELPFTRVRIGSALLSLASRGDLRRLVDSEAEGDLGASLDTMLEGIAGLAEGLHASADLSAVLDRVLEPLRVPLNLGKRPAQDVIRFSPDGGSLAGVLRALAPTVKLRDELGFVPLDRHGSTLAGIFELARAAAQTSNCSAVVAIDDFAETVDPLAAQHLASTLRRQASQLWLSTRSGSLGEVFKADEVVRLTVSHEGARKAFAPPLPATKAERIAARSLHLQLLPAVSARAVLLVEGPHDCAALRAGALRLNSDEGLPLLAARRITVVDAGSGGSSGGVGAIPKLARLAKKLGFFVIALIDWDRKPSEAAGRLQAAVEAADVVLRWPEGVAIERALVLELADEDLREALDGLSEASGEALDFDAGALSGTGLSNSAMKYLKTAGGLHGSYIEALPDGVFPPLIRSALDAIRTAVSKAGHIQL